MKHYFASFQLGSRDIQSCIVCSTERWREGCIWFDIKYQQCFSEISLTAAFQSLFAIPQCPTRGRRSKQT